MQIYSSPVLGLDLTHSAGSREGGNGCCLPVWVRPGCCILKIDSRPLFRKPLSFTCHINSCPAVPVSDAGINLTWFCCQCTDTSTWLHCENDLLYHFGCVNECHIQAIKWSFSQLYQDSITVIVRDHTGHYYTLRQSEGYALLYVASLSFCYCSDMFMMMADMPEVTLPQWWVYFMCWSLYVRTSHILTLCIESVSSYFMSKAVKQGVRVWFYELYLEKKKTSSESLVMTCILEFASTRSSCRPTG